MEHKPVCTEEGCEREQFTAKSGLCSRHYDRVRTARLAAEREDPTPVKQIPCAECGAQGYGRFPAGTGPVYCKSHWDKLHRRGTTALAPPREPAPPQGYCTTPGHEHKIEHGRTGLCQACYRHSHRRELDPEVGTRTLGRPPEPRVPAAVESHQRLTEEDKVERRRARKEAKTSCVHGHLLTPQNTYITDKGQKVCRACQRNTRLKSRGEDAPVPRQRATVTQCANGHAWSEETTYWSTSGKRVCKLCQRAAFQKSKGRAITPDTVPIGLRNKDKTHCPAGHDYAKWGRKKNTGARYCWICHRHNRIRTMYGVTPERWDDMVWTQEGRCEICSNPLTDPHVDHDHITKDPRDLLCTNCNNGLGRFFDEPALLRAAADYLERHLRS